MFWQVQKTKGVLSTAASHLYAGRRKGSKMVPERLQNGAGNASKWARRGQEPFGGSRRAFREAPRRFRGRKNIVRQVSGAEKSSPRGIFERCSRPEDEISAEKVPQEGPKKPSRGPPKCAKFRKAENAKFADSSMDFEVFVLPEGARTGPKWGPKRLHETQRSRNPSKPCREGLRERSGARQK